MTCGPIESRQPWQRYTMAWIVLFSAAGSWTQAAEPAAPPDDQPARQFFVQHCQKCHQGEKPKGDFRLESLAFDFSRKDNRERWLEVLELVETGVMPPKERPRPTARQIQSLTEWVGGRVAAASAAQGRAVLRRLNRNEYQNTLRDLLGVHVELDDLLQQDKSASGFDTNEAALHLSAPLIHSYLEAANRALDAAIANGQRPWTLKKRFDVKDEKSVKPKGSVYRHVDDGVAIFSSWVSANIQVTLWQLRTPHPGKYRIRISGYGFQTSERVHFHVKAGPLNAAAQQRLLDYFDVPANKPTVVEFVEQFDANETIRIVTDGLGAIPPQVERVGAENYKGPGLVVQWVDVEGPLMESWPPPGHRMLFGDLRQSTLPGKGKRLEVVSQEPLVDAQRVLRRFARRAFRRAVTDEDIRPFLDRVQAKLEAGDSFEEALRVGLKGILVSPHFLCLHGTTVGATPAGGANQSAAATTLDEFALASRLSYFLWSSMPDDELLALAEAGKLSRPDTLRAQVERMLADSKSAAFTSNFAGQWLDLRAIDDTTPDGMLYPEYDDVLKVSMVKEALLFFDEVLKNNLSLANFVASDFSVINGRLAKHYGIPDVDGLQFRKVAHPADSHRGGVLTMAAVLKVTANGTTTSPILRGAWVLDRILGTPPPKPTMEIEAVEPDIRGAATIRSQLAKHRDNAACAACHAKIDPPGFALENFDVIGGWRQRYRSIGQGDPATVNGRRMRYRLGPAVESADVLPDGRRFANIDQFKQLLLEDKDLLARALAGKLIEFATGTPATAGDKAEIESIVAAVRQQDYGLRSLVHEVVQSKLFRNK